MLVQFLRDVLIAVALLAALIAFAFRPAQDGEHALRGAPPIDKRIGAPPTVAGAEGVTLQPSTTSPPPQQ